MTQFTTLNVTVENKIARVTINRPEALNALNRTVLEELRTAFAGFDKDDGVRGVILTGAGEKAFVAGADITQMKGLSPVEAGEFCRLGQHTMRVIETCRVPVIAAVNGFALGGGLELALSTDFIYATKNAKFGLPEVNLGLFPGFGGTQRLSRLVGTARAKELIFTADIIGADEALAIGLANKVFEPQNLIASAEETLRKILAKGPVAVRLAKRVINEGATLPITAGLEVEAATFPQIFATEDCKIGIGAFLEKRKPDFVGR